jgi:hypothetical protein
LNSYLQKPNRWMILATLFIGASDHFWPRYDRIKKAYAATKKLKSTVQAMSRHEWQTNCKKKKNKKKK